MGKIGQLQIRRLAGGEIDTAIALLCHGMVWDGNVPSKASRDRLVEAGYAVRFEGQQALTGAGVLALAITPGFWKWALRYVRKTRRNPFVTTREQNRQAMR